MAIRWMLPPDRDLAQRERAELAGKAVAMRLRPGAGPRFFFAPSGTEIWMIDVDMAGEIALRPLPVEVGGTDQAPPFGAITFTFSGATGERGASRVIGGPIEKDDYMRMVDYLMRPDRSDPGRRRTGLNIAGALSGIRLHGTRKPTRTHMKAGTLLARIADEPQLRKSA